MASELLLSPSATQMTTVEQEALGFWRLRTRMVVRLARQALAEARLRLLLVVATSLLFWGGLFWLFYEAFSFLTHQIGLSGAVHAQTVSVIYNGFFASLMVMLIFSAGIILYGGLYCSAEAAMLLTMPVRAERIVLFKFQEAVIFSSWGFFLLGSPMLLAYGLVVQAPWYFYVVVPPYMLAFAYIPCTLGALLCLVIVHRVPGMRIHLLGIGITALVVLGICVLWSMSVENKSDLLTAHWFHDTVKRLQFSEHRLLPSWWLSSGLIEATRHTTPGSDRIPWGESIMFLTLLLSNAMLGHVAVLWSGRRLYRASYSNLLGHRSRRVRTSLAWIDRLVMFLTWPLGQQVRLLIVKDLRLFRRDPVQWSQFLIFFGLLALYFMNIRHFSYDVNYTSWVNMVSFLNLAVVGLILSTFTTRFIFPMISLEGSRFWILSQLPIDRDTILWGKFLFAAIGSIVPCTLLILLSDLMLDISLMVLLVHQLACVLLCVGLAGIAVGLGAKMPNLRERSPSKIAAGFGGTLNLVVSAAYIIAVVMLTALPCHYWVAAESHAKLAESFTSVAPFWWVIIGISSALVLAVLATVIPLRLGFKAFRKMEF